MDVQCPAGFHQLANFSHTADGADELVAKACGGGLRGDLWIDNHNITVDMFYLGLVLAAFLGFAVALAYYSHR